MPNRTNRHRVLVTRQIFKLIQKNCSVLKLRIFSLLLLIGLASMARGDGAPSEPSPMTPVRDSNPAAATGTSTNQNYWAVEDAQAREKLPLYLTIPAARPEELTPANGYPKRKTFLTWQRSHGDNGGMRYSALDQINRQNVTNLQVAWTYHSKDGSNNIQCNPIIIRDVMIVPTPGKCVVGVNAETGRELWRFKPEGQSRPAFRGLIYWPGSLLNRERVLFCAGKYLYALNPPKRPAHQKFWR